jgi:hypothetical protein
LPLIIAPDSLTSKTIRRHWRVRLQAIGQLPGICLF